MVANIDYAIVIASRYQELKNTMSHRDAMIETLNFAFPMVITSGTILAVTGTLIGQMTSEAAIVGIGQSLGRGTIISMLFVLFVLPQILLLGGGLAGYGEKLLEPLRRLTFPQTFRGEDRNTEIVCASLGNDAGLVGAAMLAE